MFLGAGGRATGSPALALDAERLEDMHARKTGALIRASAALGAIAAGADARTVDVIDAYARDLGLAFQIVDDILDVEGSSAELGKTSGKDAAAGKPTYPSIYGLARSRELAADCVTRATATLESAGLTGRLTELAAWTLNRRK
jgi:geranylgeranyl pyrophosphate synthase